MRALIAAAAFLPLLLAGAARASDVDMCRARHADITQKAAQFGGDTMIKRLIEADLRRAASELIEGDADECNEALDHASKLLSGET